MGHLLRLRRGWESEHLAVFILSKLAFCANPVTVADDLGSDFFCCLFRIDQRGTQDVIVPMNSFAIQIKSNARAFDVSGRIEYLLSLEVPFFVGVVDRAGLRLKIYSGEYLSYLFALLPLPNRLRVELVNEEVDAARCHSPLSPGGYTIRFPRVAELKANSTPHEVQGTVDLLHRRCSLIHANIAARSSEEHVYIFPNGEVRILAGPGSMLHFRERLHRRLAEAIYNVVWAFNNDPQRFDAGEAQVYMDFYRQLERRGAPLPRILTMVQDQLDHILRMLPQQGRAL